MKKKILIMIIFLSISFSLAFSQVSTVKECMIFARDCARAYWYSDAMTCMVGGWPDYTGHAWQWGYWHYSNYTTSEMYYVYAGYDGAGMPKIWNKYAHTAYTDIQRTTIPMSIIDSDQALNIAEVNGGYDFRQSHPNCSLIIHCAKYIDDYPQYFLWKVRYFFNSSVFYAYIDAETGTVLETSGGGGSTTELIYDDGSPYGHYYWNDDIIVGSRMTTPSSKGPYALSSVKIQLGNTNSGSNTFYLKVFNWSGSQPGSEILSATATGTDNQWNTWDVSSFNITFNSNTDFLVGMEFFGGNQPAWGYDLSNNGRAWDYVGGWSLWTETYFMRAIVVDLSTGIEEEIGNDLNIETISLSVSNTLINCQTTFSYSIIMEGHISLKLFDLTGREVRTLIDSHEQAGLHHVIFDGKDSNGINLPIGTYICNLTTSSGSANTKVLIIE